MKKKAPRPELSERDLASRRAFEATTGMHALFKQLTEENPKASQRETLSLFVDAIREDEDLTREAVNWFCAVTKGHVQ